MLIWGTMGGHFRGHLPQMFIVNVIYFKFFFTLAKRQKIGVKWGCFRAFFQTLKLEAMAFKSQKGKASKKPL